MYIHYAYLAVFFKIRKLAIVSENTSRFSISQLLFNFVTNKTCWHARKACEKKERKRTMSDVTMTCSEEINESARAVVKRIKNR